MDERLKEILDDHKDQLTRYEFDVANIEAKLIFYTDHKLEEELRITRVKHDTLHMAIYRWRKMVTELDELLNKWNS